jgi:hypothetical protein
MEENKIEEEEVKLSIYQKYIKPRRDTDPEYRQKLNNIAKECMRKKYKNSEEARKICSDKHKIYYQQNKERQHEYYIQNKEKNKQLLKEKKEQLQKNIDTHNALTKKIADMIAKQMDMLNME